ncbi:MAG TPA: hypothetical protein VIX91_05445 [Candidatus Acidoferrum sp.]
MTRAGSLSRALYIVLILTAVLSTSDFRSIANDIRSSRQEIDQPSREKVDKLLSDQKIDDSEAVKLIFKEGDTALPTLVSSLGNGKNVERASWALAYLGGANERKVLRDVIAREKNEEQKGVIAGFLAGALVEPASAEEWQFLESCLREYKNEDRALASFAAAIALGTNGSQHALALLQSVAPREPEASNSDNDTIQAVRQAIRWIKQGAGKGSIRHEPESDSDQIKQIVLQETFFAGAQRKGTSVEQIAFTRDRSRALVSVQIYRGPRDAHGYNLVVERRNGMWKVTGAWLSWVS